MFMSDFFGKQDLLVISGAIKIKENINYNGQTYNNSFDEYVFNTYSVYQTLPF